jgi:nitrogen fixation NifU-like protein
MAYSDKVLDHYENPRNVGSFDKGDPSVGTGMVGAPACGDVMKLQIKVNEQGVIEDARFKTYGCGSAIASSSLLTEWVKGKTLDQAAQIKNTQIAEELALPPVKARKRPRPSRPSSDSAMMLRAELPVHRNRTLVGRGGMDRS